MLLIVAVLPHAAQGHAAEGSLAVIPSTTAVAPGEAFGLSLRARYPLEYTAPAPAPWLWVPTGLAVRTHAIHPFAEGGVGGFDVDAQVVADKKGLFAVGPVVVTAAADDGATLTVTSDTLYLEIPPGEGADLADLRPLKPPQPIRVWWPAAAAVGGGALAASVLWLWRRRTSRGETPVDPFVALESAIATLRATAPPGPVDRATAFALSDALRAFAERQSGVAALEMTGREFRRAAAHLRGPLAPTWQAVAQHCERLEMVKFGPSGRGDRTLEQWLEPVAEWVRAVRASQTRGNP
jgi:hypothetical protein